MTDNEIKKALEHCVIYGAEGCINCPLYQKPNCFQILSKGSLSIINRYEAEIENFSHNIKKLTEEHTRLQKMLDDKCDRCIARTKAEANKEFAERLCEGRVSNDPVVIAAKCLLKEMAGED